jgi:rhamnogalacturonan endolyase
MKNLSRWYALLLVGLLAGSAGAQPIMERLGRGVVGINQGDGKVFISWRLLGTDPQNIAFNLYRRSGDGEPQRLNPQPIANVTFYQDSGADLSKPTSYFVRPVVDAQEQAPSTPFSFAANAPAQPYLSVKIDDSTGVAEDASVGDLDGDGEYEIVIRRTGTGGGRGGRGRGGGAAPGTLLEAYKLDGRKLWTIHIAHRWGNDFIVYDLDGDGIAEVTLQTGDNTVSGTGERIGEIMAGVPGPATRPATDQTKYFTIFSGKDGSVLASEHYFPTSDPADGWGGRGGNGGTDNGSNRANRFCIAAAYLDGKLPSIVFGRGIYGRSVLSAWDWRGGKLTRRWVFDSGVSYPPFADASPFSGMGNHNISVADVDFDGKDKIIYGAMVVDDDGKGLASSGTRHGDALHVGDFDPSRPGLEVLKPTENEDDTTAFKTPGLVLYDPANGKILVGELISVDTGRANAADIDPRHPGAELWVNAGSGVDAFVPGLWNVSGKKITEKRPQPCNFLVWWDGDPLRELVDRNYITKWDWIKEEDQRLLTAEGASANAGTKAVPCLSGDILGDWREEIIWRAQDNAELRIYTTTIPTDRRIYTLMHDPQYRCAIAWQNLDYNQPPHPSFFIGNDMKAPPKPNIVTAGANAQAGGNP